MIAAAGWADETITLWDARTGRRLGLLEGAGAVEALALDARGALLAAVTGAPAGLEVRLWDIGSRRQLGSRALASGRGAGAEEGEPPQLAFLRGGRSLAVLGVDARPLVLDLHPDSWIALACRVAGRDLGREEWARLVGDAFRYERACTAVSAAGG